MVNMCQFKYHQELHGQMAELVKSSDPVTLIRGSGVRFPAISHRNPRQASRPTLPPCVLDKRDRDQSVNKSIINYKFTFPFHILYLYGYIIIVSVI